MDGEGVAEGSELRVASSVDVEGTCCVLDSVGCDRLAVGPLLPGVECLEAVGLVFDGLGVEGELFEEPVVALVVSSFVEGVGGFGDDTSGRRGDVVGRLFGSVGVGKVMVGDGEC